MGKQLSFTLYRQENVANMGGVCMSVLFFKETPELETERLVLRKITMEDAEDIYDYASDEEVPRYMTWNTHKNIDNTKAFINFILKRYEMDDAGEWGIILKRTGRLIGCIGFANKDEINRRAEVGYVLSRKYWGQGIMPEALRRILQFGFEEMGLNRIECCHFLPNERSGRVMQKAGMSFEGIAREKFYKKEKYWDLKQYAIIKADWDKQNSVK